MDLLHQLSDLRSLIVTVGYIGLFLIVFAESGLLVGFFLPGDSLLFTAGFLAAQGVLDLKILIPLLLVAAISGDQVGYGFGYRVGPRLFNREDSFFFHKKHLAKAHAFYETHGGKAIILARFMPIVRTFAPIVAGMGSMTYRKFVSFNVIGGFVWVVGLTSGGFLFGNLIPDVDKYLLPVIALIIIASIAPSAWHIYKENRTEIHRQVRLRLGGRRSMSESPSENR